jgi:hypothetical protein
MLRRWRWAAVGVLLVVFLGCAETGKLSYERRLSVYRVERGNGGLLERFAPAFAAYNHRDPWNRIGRPCAEIGPDGKERVRVDPDQPVVYTMTRRFSTDRGRYTNLIYRIHFTGVPYSLIPFHLTAGENVGLLAVVTLDETNRPVLFTTVNTCGCYLAILPTTDLPEACLPGEWKGSKPLDVFGETLPAEIDYKGAREPRVLIHLRPDVHRVMDVEVVEASVLEAPWAHHVIPAPTAPMASLERLPVTGGGRTTSFYSGDWVDRGHVKASYKVWETLLMSWWSLDFFVGADKAYADPAETGNPFYTSLKPWNRTESDMWHFERFLRFWGWRL